MTLKLIKNGNILTITKGSMNGDILIENGKIKAVGRELKFRDDCEIIDASGCFVMPGMIDSHTHIGLWEEGIGKEGWDGNECSDPITPQLRAVDGINPDDLGFKDAISAGITSVGVHPGSANVIGGQGVALKTTGKTIDSMIIKDPVGIKVAFGENPKSVYIQEKKSPQTRMAIAGLLREYLHKTNQYIMRKEMARDGKAREPDFDVRLEALSMVLKKEVPIMIHAHRSDDIMTGIRIAEEFNIRYTLEHCTEGYLLLDELKKRNPMTAVGPVLVSRMKVELRNRSFENASLLAKSGVKVSLITDHSVLPIISLSLCAALSVKFGMDREDALKAITINPAEHLGISNRVGSIEAGKDADVVILDGDPLKIESQIKKVFLNGDIVFDG